MEKLYVLLEQVTKTPNTGVKEQDIRAQLESYINELILQDFPKLADLLYRVDIPEKKLKELLAAQQNTDSAALITELIIERQLQKQAWKQSHPPTTDIPEDERW